MNEHIITMEGKYKYRNGEPARVLCVDRRRERTVVSIDKGGCIVYHDPNGLCNSDETPHELDLIPDVPLWEGEIWVHPDGRISLNPNQLSDGYVQGFGYRKIKAREVEPCQS